MQSVLAKSDLGSRVVVRRRAGFRDERPTFSDVLGELTDVTDTALTISTSRGLVVVPVAEVHRAKVVPPRRGHTAREIAALERAATAAWPAPHLAHLGEWLLRAANGYTGRANSALPLGDPGLPLPQALAHVADFYRGHGLPPQMDVPLPLAASVQRELLKAGWQPRCTVLVQAADVPALIAATPAGAGFVLSSTPSAQALALMERQLGPLPEAAHHVLTAVPELTFAELYDETGALLTRARGTVTRSGDGAPGWLGVFAVETAPAAQRRGLARAALGVLARWAEPRGATRAFVQVESNNAAAMALYEKLGFTTHHHYTRYRLG